MKEDVKKMLQQLLAEHKRLGIAEQLDYTKFYLYSIITHSTAIEGSTVTEVEAQLLFDEGITSSKRTINEQNMNLDLRDAYLYGMEWIKQHKPITTVINCMSALHCRHIQHDIANYNESVGDKIGDKSNEISQIGDKKAIILAFIADNPGARASVIADHIGLKASRTRDYLSELVKEGRLTTEGANKNRTYKIAKEDNR